LSFYFLGLQSAMISSAGSFGPTEFGWQKYVLDENVSGTYNTRLLPITVSLERSRMPEIVAESPAPSCCLLLSESEIEESQRLGPDPFLPRARETRGRFANGSSGNPRGRPRGIRNPRRPIPDLVARPLSAPALSRLLDRKPHLLRPLAAQLLPPPLAAVDPAGRLGIDVSSLRSAEDCREVTATVRTAIARGQIAPCEGARIARRVRARLRWVGKSAKHGKTASGFFGEGLCCRPGVVARDAPLRRSETSVGGKHG
jgi:hypothetical protein